MAQDKKTTQDIVNDYLEWYESHVDDWIAQTSSILLASLISFHGHDGSPSS